MTALQARPATAPAANELAGLLQSVLAESRELTAVERFAKAHEGHAPAQARYYRDLIPTGLPGVGQQYAFDVDLDACSGCKACVSACHHLNGLEPEETWRSVGQLYGQNGLPVLQHVTTACHHCIDPGCLSGCPTNAYEKDPVTGVVRHLDDQCFGCQYCTMACPYEAPQYSKSKGIVRKCDLCHGRLAAGEAPACVQACPNGAIRIAVVDVAAAALAADSGVFLPDSPPPGLTKPTTRYRRRTPLPTNAAGADFGHAEPQHAHAPLVAMLVLTQMSVGALTAGVLGRWLGANLWPDLAIVLGAVVGQLGLAAAPLHLGRPHLAFRAVLGWRHSWLSREAIVFGLYAAFSVGAAACAAAPLIERLPLPGKEVLRQAIAFTPRAPAEVLAILAGVAAIYCSAKIYTFTAREFWLGLRTHLKFFGSAAVLGPATGAGCAGLAGASPTAMAALAAVLGMAKLAWEAAFLRRVGDPAGVLRLSAKLQLGPLKAVTLTRFGLGIVGLLLLAASAVTRAATPAVLGLLLLVLGELAERSLYFSTVVPLRMPGGTPTR